MRCKRTHVWLVVILLSTILTTAARAQQEDPAKENVGTFMRAKLNQAQNVLEGLTTENYNLAAKSSQEMSLLSQAAQWQVIQTPEYARRSAEFRREVDKLTEAAKKKNLDAATLAYVKVTLNCVECHKYVRGVRQANLDMPSPRAETLVLRQGTKP